MLFLIRCISQFLSNYFSTEYDPTGDEYRKMMTVDGADCMVEVDEIGAEQMSISQWFTLQVQRAKAVVIVYSVVERASFERVEALMADVRKVQGMSG